LSLADLNRDGVPDVVVGGTDGFVYCLSGKNGQLLWSAETRGAILGATLLHDITGDGVPDAFVGSGDGTLYAINGADGLVLWKMPTKSRIESCLGWATEAGEDVLLLGNSEGRFYGVTPKTGQVRWETKADAPLLYPPRLEDQTVLLPTPQSSGDVRTYTPVSLADHKAGASSDNFPQWLDLTGDGKPKKLVVTPTGTSLYDADGKTLLWSRDYLVVGTYAADINRDGVLDLIFNNGPDQLLCLSGLDGTILGRIQMENAVGRGYAIEDVDADGVPDLVVGVGRQLTCFSWVGGRKRWGVKGESYFDTPAVAAGSGVIVKNQAGELTCLEPSQGEVRWRVKTAPQPSPHAAVATDGQIVADADAKNRRLLVLRADTGKELWRAKLPGDPDTEIAAPAIASNLVVVGGQAFQADTGTLLWSAPLTKPMAAPAISRDMVVAADGENALWCLEAVTGKERWRFRAPTKDAFPSAPLLYDITGDGVEDAVAVNNNGYTYALNGKTGQVLWQMEHAATRGLTRNRMVLAATNGVVATGKGDVFCVNLKDGKPVWRVALKESVLGAPAVCDLNGDGVADVVVGTMARRLYCLDGRDGARLWQFEVGAQIRFNAPLPVKIPQETVPVIVVGTGPPDNTLYCLRGDCGRARSREWFGPWRELTRAR
jgi:outer membrane protein assembly factor BamB